jgi:hypothetical protein
VFAPLIGINIPPLTKGTFKHLLTIATFDVLKTDDWFPILFNFSKSSPLNERFGEIFETTILIMNLGTLWLVGIYCMIMYLLYFALYKCEVPCIEKFRQKLATSLFWNGTIDFLNQGYIEFVFSVFLTIKKGTFDWDNWGGVLNNVSFLFYSTIVFTWPIFLQAFLHFKYD